MKHTVIDYDDLIEMLEKLRKEEEKLCADYMYWNPTDKERIKIRDDRLSTINMIQYAAQELKKTVVDF